MESFKLKPSHILYLLTSKLVKVSMAMQCMKSTPINA